VHLKFGLKKVVAFGERHLIRGGLLQYKFSLKLRKENALASLRSSDSALYIPKIPNLLNLLGKNNFFFLAVLEPLFIMLPVACLLYHIPRGVLEARAASR
jgi:hypothetical protein